MNKEKTKILTDRQLYKKVAKEYRDIQKVEYDIMLSRLPKLIESDLVPVEWRHPDNKMLYKYLLDTIQIEWKPVKIEDKVTYDILKNIDL